MKTFQIIVIAIILITCVNYFESQIDDPFIELMEEYKENKREEEENDNDACMCGLCDDDPPCMCGSCEA